MSSLILLFSVLMFTSVLLLVLVPYSILLFSKQEMEQIRSYRPQVGLVRKA